ncbi:MAG: alanine--tRNA ligase [Rhodospirillales bacterium]|nr:alanine--tRNA ligase [Rhodospirillales bacterium]MSP79446.1 alanine--tRNA ligase [Rhodospirillales bacterium]
MHSVNDIRRAFLDYFARHGHAVVESSALLPRNDPTLMFVNSGMVQFKNVFTGLETRPYKRAVTSQKCVRAGGKHNDLENVGHTARHHTFFEMLGNFSFGDYFKDVAIELAWNLVTKEFGLDPDRLVITVHTSDEEAAGHWRKIAGLPDARIIRIPTSDNFWSMGETGPCGPCTEIFYDHGAHIPGGPPGTPEAEGDRFIEIWNLVFMQFEQVDATTRRNLPKPSVDTGMGLERIAAVLQGTNDNYAIDLLRGLIEESARASGVDPDGPHRVSHRVVADHLRAACFLIADGVLPSNEGRGYVLRRIMRRAMRHAQLIGCCEPLLHRLVPALVAAMGVAFPELERAEPLMTEALKLEETRFRQMLERGLKLLDEATGSMAKGAKLDGETAFKLYDTFGFPLDLTQDALKGRGLGVDEAGFQAAMARQREDARKAWTGSGEAATEQVWFQVRDEAGATEFLGYATETAEAKIAALVKGGACVAEARAGDEIAVVVNQTPFYGESGGQIGDTGRIKTATGAEATVRDTQKKAGEVHVHICRVEKGTFKLGDPVTLAVDGERRRGLRAHHSATHLLHEALRRRLGPHVTQKGSLVAPDRLRFDISHPKALGADDLAAVEADVNRQIRRNEAVVTRLMDPEEAVKAGAMALFGEKYGSEVRVVAMGAGAESGAGGAKGDVAAHPFSVELCGGTHVGRTGDIGLLHIVAESAVGAGVRRIEAVTGEAATGYFQAQESLLRQAADTLKVQPAEVPARLAALLDERKKLERELTETRQKLGVGGTGTQEVQEIKGVRFVPRLLEGVPARDLKPMADVIKQRIGSGVVALVSVEEGRASLVVGVTDDLTQKISAVDLVRAGAAAVNGKGGGGRPDMAQAGGPDGARAADALKAIEAALAGGA